MIAQHERPRLRYTMSKNVIMQFTGPDGLKHDIEGDGATLAYINDRLTQLDVVLSAVRKLTEATAPAIKSADAMLCRVFDQTVSEADIQEALAVHRAGNNKS